MRFHRQWGSDAFHGRPMPYVEHPCVFALVVLQRYCDCVHPVSGDEFFLAVDKDIRGREPKFSPESFAMYHPAVESIVVSKSRIGFVYSAIKKQLAYLGGAYAQTLLF